MSNRYKKKKEVRNKSRDMLVDFYKTGREWDKDNRQRREEAGEKENRGLRNLNTFEKTCVVIIVLGIILFIVKVFVLGHSITAPGI
ncbi:MAG: hypothetical protein MR991_04985 [Clostridiales bacterium]|nr:hypothetical protein [Clostridiales bacterium]MDD7035091.1 hypothetical protein [Bacillota bacterium]MDY2920416.1 hypothetical protein [Lentihominibacter sp.]